MNVLSELAEYQPYESRPFFGANGRVDLLSTPKDAFDIPTTTRMDNRNFSREAIYGQTAPTAVSELFFSPTNVDALHQGIRYKVFTATGGRHIIGRQSDMELRIIMRSIYYQFSRNQADRVVDQVRELNARVLDYAVPNVITNLKQFETFREDVSRMPEPLLHAELLNMRGTRTLEFKGFV
jgi:hypothetical protein